MSSRGPPQQVSSRNAPVSDNPSKRRPVVPMGVGGSKQPLDGGGGGGGESSRCAPASKRGAVPKMNASGQMSVQGKVAAAGSVRKNSRRKRVVARSKQKSSSVEDGGGGGTTAATPGTVSNDAPKETPTKKRKKGPLKIDGVFEGDSSKYQVLKLIRNPGPNAEYYVKDGETEKVLRLGQKGKKKLRYAGEIMKKVLEANAGNDKVFMLEVTEVGTNSKYDYLITTSYGIQLYECFRATGKVFTPGCIMNIAYQTLECIKALHTAGFINRNVKPATFSLGQGAKESQICMSDFRIARRHIEENGKTRAARPRIEYIGTLRYASMAALKEAEQSRKDDLESWLYMIYDFFDGAQGLPWKGKGGASARKEVLGLKEKFWAHAEPTVYTIVPEGFKKIVDMIYGMTYDTTPDYSKMFEVLDEICTTHHLDRNVCDWTGKFATFASCQKAIDDAANKTNDNVCSGIDDFEFGPKKAAPKVQRKMMNANDTIKNGKFVWKVVNVLGSGGFGDVYRVYNELDKKKKNYALKTESEDGKKVMLRLKVEMQVMMAIQEDRRVNKKPNINKHFVEFVDRGKAEELKCKFIVMSIVGPSLDDVRKKYRVDLSTKSTPFNVACQTLEALRDLHTIGFLHRDIKPANFAVGIDKEEPLIYMLDFGICRMFLDPKTKVLRAPRKKVKFLGTLRYASRACMKCEDQGRKDDLECWLYMIFDIMDPEDGVPWKKICDRDKIVVAKTAFFQMKLSIVYENITRQMKTLVKYVDSLEYQSLPDYAYIENRLQLIADHVGYPMTNKRKPEWCGRLRKEDLDQVRRFEDSGSDSDETGGGTNDSD